MLNHNNRFSLLLSSYEKKSCYLDNNFYLSLLIYVKFNILLYSTQTIYLKTKQLKKLNILLILIIIIGNSQQIVS